MNPAKEQAVTKLADRLKRAAVAGRPIEELEAIKAKLSAAQDELWTKPRSRIKITKKKRNPDA